MLPNFLFQGPTWQYLALHPLAVLGHDNRLFMNVLYRKTVKNELPYTLFKLTLGSFGEIFYFVVVTEKQLHYITLLLYKLQKYKQY